MEKFIALYEKSNLGGYFDEHRLKALGVLYALAKTCATKEMRPWELINGEEAVCAKIALYAAGGLRVENMLPWQESLKEICQTAVGKLVEKNVLTKEEGFACLIEPLNKKEFSPEYMTAIFNEIAIIIKGKLNDVFAHQMQSD